MKIKINSLQGMCYFEGDEAFQLAENWLDNKILELELKICDGMYRLFRILCFKLLNLFLI